MRLKWGSLGDLVCEIDSKSLILVSFVKFFHFFRRPRILKLAARLPRL